MITHVCQYCGKVIEETESLYRYTCLSTCFNCLNIESDTIRFPWKKFPAWSGIDQSQKPGLNKPTLHIMGILGDINETD